MIAEKPEQLSEGRIQKSIYFRPEHLERLEELARREDTPATVLIRRAVLRLLEEAGL